MTGLHRRTVLSGSLATFAVALLGACTGETPPAEPEATPPAPPSKPATLWTADNITTLVPRMPTRKSGISRPVPPLPAYDVALGILGTVVDRYASDPKNPWAIAHGVLARGLDFRLADGTEAITHVFSTYAEPRVVGSHTLVGFPTQQGDVLVEPHSDLILKNFAEVGLSPEASYTVAGRTVTAADLYRYTLLKTYLVAEKNHSSFKSPNDIPWALQALVTWAPEDEVQWLALDRTPMDLDFLSSFLAAVLTQESAFLFEKMQRDQPFEKQGQNLYGYTCGGAHLVQGAAYAVARAFGSAKDRKAVEAQVPLWLWRLPGELQLYDEVLKRNPAERRRLLAQRLKFLGHFLETMAKMQAMGLYTPTEAQATLIEGAAQNLTLTVDALHKTGVYDQLDTIRSKDEALYLDLIGDSCHAIRGLELVLGRQTVLW